MFMHVINALLQKVSISVYLSIHKLSNSILSTEPSFRSKNVFIDTQIYHTLSLYRSMVSLSVNLSTHKAIKLYPTQSYQTLYYTKLSNSILHKAIKLYPTQRYQTLSYTKLSNSILSNKQGSCLTMYLLTHKAIRLYSLYRAMVVLTVV